MEDHLTSFEKVIKEFEGFSKEEKYNPTFLEICGYPHYEKVISNILTYYFNNSNDHGEGTMLVRALLSGTELEDVDNEELQVEDAITEVQTYRGKFIDIVIETEAYLIGIENKIYASECNPFDEYEIYIKKEAKKLGKVPVCILISLKKNIYNVTNSEFFYRVTYSDFFRKLDELNKGVTNRKNVNSNYSIFLNDFKQTILNMSKKKFTEEEINFLSNN